MPIILLSYHISQFIEISPTVKASFFDNVDSAIDDVIDFLVKNLNILLKDVTYRTKKLSSKQT